MKMIFCIIFTQQIRFAKKLRAKRANKVSKLKRKKYYWSYWQRRESDSFVEKWSKRKIRIKSITGKSPSSSKANPSWDQDALEEKIAGNKN